MDSNQFIIILLFFSVNFIQLNHSTPIQSSSLYQEEEEAEQEEPVNDNNNQVNNTVLEHDLTLNHVHVDES